MYLKSLLIKSKNKVIREIIFHGGINLIVDESAKQVTGNNVGKTTVLKLIDYCLGGDQRQIYIDPETKRDEYALVKDFLINSEVVVTLTLCKDLNNQDSDCVTIERNFLSRSKAIRKINGKDTLAEDFEGRLKEYLFPDHTADKPSFRQLISHNIRYKDESINNTLKTLDKYTSDAEYEALYLYMFGCDYDNGDRRQEILTKIQQESSFKKRLESQQTKNTYESALALVDDEIDNLNTIKTSLNINKNFEKDLEHLNQIRYRLNVLASDIGKLNIRRDLIVEAEETLENNKADIDLNELKSIYEQAKSQIGTMHYTFVELVSYHNKMTEEKIKFIVKELPNIESEITTKNNELKILLIEEERAADVIAKSDSYEELEEIIIKLNEQYRKKGDYESTIGKIEESEKIIDELTKELKQIDSNLFSESFETKLKEQIKKFNKYFSSVSEKLYGEKYALTHDIVTNKKGQTLYKFSAFNTNLSSGKKQGEISCFDIAYILFADEENIPTMHFLLNDKKELMHDNQLVRIADLVTEANIQFVASILKDKLPIELNDEKYFVIKLSQSDKLFRIENQ